MFNAEEMKTSHISGLVITVVALGPKLRPSYSEFPLLPTLSPLTSLRVYSKKTPWQTTHCHLSQTARGSCCIWGGMIQTDQTACHAH